MAKFQQKQQGGGSKAGIIGLLGLLGLGGGVFIFRDRIFGGGSGGGGVPPGGGNGDGGQLPPGGGGTDPGGRGTQDDFTVFGVPVIG